MAEVYHRHLRNFLLDRKLQLRYTLIMVVLSSLLTAGLGYVWYQQMRETSMAIEIKALGSMGVDARAMEELNKEMEAHDNTRLLVLVGFGVLFALVVAGYGIILTHKIAGPLYKISRYMHEIEEGRLGPVYDLRRGDQLLDFFESFKQMHGALRTREEGELNALNEIIEVAEQHLTQSPSSTLQQGLAQLRELREGKRTRLGA